MTRLERLRTALDAKRLDGLLVTDRVDMRYLSGFAGSSGALLVTASEQLLITDFRYFTQAAEQAADWELVKMPSGQSLIVTAAKTIAERTQGRIGFQADQITFGEWEKLGVELGGFERLASTKGIVSELRWIKEPAEVAAIRAAAALADDVMRRGWAAVREGLTERELKAELDYYMVSRGADGPSFEMIIASGPNSALPHAPISDRAFTRGDLITFDLGCVVDGYCSDLTRTVALGPPTAEQQAIYRIVYEAQLAALAAIRPGAVGKDVDEVARAIIREAGHDEHYGHGLGHGVGLAIHEGPRLSPNAEMALATGHVVTVEPGIYIPEWGGVRIEDLVLVTEDGCEVLSAVEKPGELLVL